VKPDKITAYTVHCNQLIPYVGDCKDVKTGFLHYIFECSGCHEGERTAQKTIKFKHEEEKVTECSKQSRCNELADDFL